MLIAGCVWLPVLLAYCATPAHAQSIPRAAHAHRADLTRQARLVWGLDAPVATFAAQIHQESGWRPDARSAYAHGLAQFTPDTAQWIAGMDEALAGADTGNPTWALRALVRYDAWLWERVPLLPWALAAHAEDHEQCLRMSAVLRAYNGGLGWLRKEARAKMPCTAFRSPASCQENLAYPQRILGTLEPLYGAAQWGAGSCA